MSRSYGYPPAPGRRLPEGFLSLCFSSILLFAMEIPSAMHDWVDIGILDYRIDTSGGAWCTTIRGRACRIAMGGAEARKQASTDYTSHPTCASLL